MKYFPGATSKEGLDYVDLTFNDKLYNIAILRVGVNDLLNNNNTNKVDDLISDLKSMALKCLSNVLSKVVVSGVISNKLKSDTFVIDVNKKIVRMCRENSLLYMCNVSIQKAYLFVYGLH